MHELVEFENKQLKFKTFENLPIILNNFMEYTSNQLRKSERSQPIMPKNLPK
jgi:hypothetical protein